MNEIKLNTEILYKVIFCCIYSIISCDTWCQFFQLLVMSLITWLSDKKEKVLFIYNKNKQIKSFETFETDNILFPNKFLKNGLGILWLILHESVITMLVLKYYLSFLYFFISWYSSLTQSFTFSPNSLHLNITKYF